MSDQGMVVVGAGKAGARAVVALREYGWTGAITLIGNETFLPYDRPPLSKAAISDEAEPEPTLLLDDDMLKSLSVDWRSSAAVSIDRQDKSVQLADGTNVPYQKLLIATGAKARRLTLPGAERAMMLRDFGDAQLLRRAFVPGQSLAIIGGGFIGLELAASANKRGCRVSVIEMQPRVLMRGVPSVISDVVAARHAAAGVDIITSVKIDHIDESAVVLDDRRRIDADVLVAGIGAVPAIALGEAAGLTIDNGISCDTHMRTSDPDIYAAGDCCSFPHRAYGGRRMRLEAWRSAQDQAAVAAENMLGGDKELDAIPWFWSDQYELTLQIAGAPDEGSATVTRHIKDAAFIVFHQRSDGTLAGASGIGPGNAIVRDIRLAEMLIGKGIVLDPAALADANVQLKALLRA